MTINSSQTVKGKKNTCKSFSSISKVTASTVEYCHTMQSYSLHLQMIFSVHDQLGASLPYMGRRWGRVVHLCVSLWCGKSLHSPSLHRGGRSRRAEVRRVFHSYGQTERQTWAISEPGPKNQVLDIRRVHWSHVKASVQVRWLQEACMVLPCVTDSCISSFFSGIIRNNVLWIEVEICWKIS